MDIVIYVGIALLLAIALFFALGKKPTESKGGEAPSKPKAPQEATRSAPSAIAGKPETATAKPEASPSDAAHSARAVSPAKPTAGPDVSEPARGSEQTAAPETPSEPEPGESPAPPSSGVRSEPPSSTEQVAQRIDTLREGLTLSRGSGGFFGRLKALFTRKGEIPPGLVEEIEEVLLSSDVGVATTTALLAGVRDRLGKGELSDPEAVWSALRARARELLSIDPERTGLRFAARPTVVLLVGVNGAGKTTTIGKLATQLRSRGKKCVLAAGDTFRAAAVQQLIVWGDRVGCEVVRGKDGSDPGSVIFDAIKRATETGADVVLADTAGRLHTKANLMSEMQKIVRTVGKAMDGAPHETLLVIDATNGQNALAQADEFKQKLSLTGIVLTKLDGTAKGGVVLGIANTLRLPVRFIGLGERPDDLHEFVVDDFVEALLGKERADS